MEYNKLVRDRIPEILKQKGINHSVRIAIVKDRNFLPKFLLSLISQGALLVEYLRP